MGIHEDRSSQSFASGVLAVRCNESSALVNRRQRAAKNGLGLFRRAALYQDGGFVDAVTLELLHRNAPGVGLAAPIAELDPAPHHIVIGDRAPLVLAAPDYDRRSLDQPEQPNFATALASRNIGNGDIQLAVDE